MLFRSLLDDIEKDITSNMVIKYKVEEIRNEKDKEKQKNIKLSLPMVCFHSFMSPNRSQEQVKEGTGLACIDFDDIPHEGGLDFEKLWKVLKGDQYTFLLFHSPRGGIKLIVKHDYLGVNNEEFKSVYRQIQSYFNRYAISDNAPCSIASTCFLSHDIELFKNENSTIFH